MVCEGRYSRGKWDTNQHKAQTGYWQCRKADMQSHGWGILPKISEVYTAPSTQVLAVTPIITSPWAGNKSTRNNLSSYLDSSIPYKTLPSAQQSSLCVRIEVACPLTDILFWTQTNFTKIYKSCSSPLTYPECPEALYSLQLCCWHCCSCWQSWSFLLSRNVDICEKKS